MRRATLFPALLCLACLAAALSVGAEAGRAATNTAKLTPVQQQAADVAAADPHVAAVLDAAGTPQVSRVVDWTNGAGSTVYYAWPASAAGSVSDVWPLVKTDSGNGSPVAPYMPQEHRLRIADLTGLRVDVARSAPRVVQIMPVDAATEFQLHEQTWAPFSWFPWFTARPWVLVPVFLGIAVIVIWRAWLRSRAWNRRLPSMTRHDRQFIGRFAVIIFLLAGFAWQIYEAIVAATGPTAEPHGASAGDLATLPILLIPPGLFLAALVLELSWQSHRVAWGLLAVLAAAGSAYGLATAMTGTANNLNLTYFILLAVLALVAIPRAFSMGKMGWSRSFSPRYG